MIRRLGKSKHIERRAYRIVTWVTILALGVLWLAFAVWAYDQHASRRQNIERVLDRQRAAVAEQVNSLFSTAETFLTAANRWIADHPTRDPRSDPDFSRLVQDLQRVTNKSMTFRLIEADGKLNLIPEIPGALPANVADRDYFVGAIHRDPGMLTISTPYKGRATGHYAIAVASRLERPSHGVVLANVAIEVSLLQDSFAKTRVMDGGVVSLFRRDGRLLVRSTGKDVELMDRDLSASALFREGVARASEGVIDYDSAETDGVPRVVAFGSLKNYPLVVVVGAPARTVASETFTNVLRVGLLLLFGTGLILLAYWKIGQLVDQQLRSRRQLLASLARLADEVKERSEIEARLKASEAELLQMVATDSLTGLYTRRHFDERAEEEFRRGVRFAQPLSVLMLDLDYFKRINDTWGHAKGDQALRIVARTLADQLRDIDIIGRYGGEEFAVLLPGTDASGAWEAAERLRMAVSQIDLSAGDGAPIPLTISIGVAAREGGDISFPELLMRADAALYRAKADGRNRIVVADLAMIEAQEAVLRAVDPNFKTV